MSRFIAKLTGNRFGGSVKQLLPKFFRHRKKPISVPRVRVRRTAYQVARSTHRNYGLKAIGWIVFILQVIWVHSFPEVPGAESMALVGFGILLGNKLKKWGGKILGGVAKKKGRREAKLISRLRKLEGQEKQTMELGATKLSVAANDLVVTQIEKAGGDPDSVINRVNQDAGKVIKLPVGIMVRLRMFWTALMRGNVVAVVIAVVLVVVLFFVLRWIWRMIFGKRKAGKSRSLAKARAAKAKKRKAA